MGYQLHQPRANAFKMHAMSAPIKRLMTITSIYKRASCGPAREERR